MPIQQQAILEMYFWQALPTSQIAALANVSVGTVRSRLRLGLKALREVLPGIDLPAGLSLGDDEIQSGSPEWDDLDLTSGFDARDGSVEAPKAENPAALVQTWTLASFTFDVRPEDVSARAEEEFARALERRHSGVRATIVARRPGSFILVILMEGPVARMGAIERDVRDGHGPDLDVGLGTRAVRVEYAPVTAASVTTVDCPEARAPASSWDVFISYATVDRDWVLRLAENLYRLGFEVFIDAWEIIPGEVVNSLIERGLRDSRCGVVVVSDGALVRPWVAEEYAVLLNNAVTRGQRLIPVLHDLKDAAFIPPGLSIRQWVDFRGLTGAEYVTQVHRLGDAIRGVRPARPRRDGTVIPPVGTTGG